MQLALLHTDVQDFIFSYEGDLSKLAFAGSPFPEISTQELLRQIESRRAIEKKLPTWFSTKKIYYPPKLNLEQTSSEISAAYKASIIKGKSLADVTGGFGVDSFYFAENFSTVSHFENNESLAAIAAYNFSVFNKFNIVCNPADGLSGISNACYDVIYIDPSRRNEKKGKVFFLKDCVPNVVDRLDFLLERCNILLIKTSPMLDLSVGLTELKNVTEIHCVAIQNEVKELLWVVKKKTTKDLHIKTVNFTRSGEQKFSFEWESDVQTVYSEPLRFLYEPNGALLKTGGFQYLSEAFKVKKLHQHSHLFTSDVLRDFPGRRFRIETVVPYSKKEMQRGITFAKANIATRNFPESVATIRKKWKIKEGGDTYLFFTILENEAKIMLICKKIQL